MNGLCPACRRKYDDSTVQWKQISPEELASYRETQAQQAKRKAAARQKELQRREADSLSRKHLAGIRVRQKNLVYVTGLAPTMSENQLAEHLRSPQYFGQYGKIIKVVVSKGKESTHNHQSVGVYITFARKEDAAQCISAVDGHVSGDVRLRYVQIQFQAYEITSSRPSQGAVWYHKVLLGISAKRSMQQQKLHVPSRAWRRKRKFHSTGSLIYERHINTITLSSQHVFYNITAAAATTSASTRATTDCCCSTTCRRPRKRRGRK